MCARGAGTHGDVLKRTHGDVLSGHTVFVSVSHTTHHTAHTPHRTHTTTQHNTTPHGDGQRQTETDRDRQRQRKKTEKEDRDRERREDGRGETRQEKRRQKKTRQDKRREKIHFQCGGAWPFLVGGVICLFNSVNDRDLCLLYCVMYDSFLITGFVVQSAHFQKLPLPVLFFRRSFSSGNFYRFYFSERQFRICQKLPVTSFIPQNFIGNHFGQHDNKTERAKKRRP